MIYLLTGLSGSGKTTVGKALAKALNCRFYEADDYHSKEDTHSIAHGVPLSEHNWKSWIFAVRSVIDMELAVGGTYVMACSALKEAYRTTITGGRHEIKLVYLKANEPLLRARIGKCNNGKAREAILTWQLSQLEEPKDALSVDATLPAAEIVKIILG